MTVELPVAGKWIIPFFPIKAKSGPRLTRKNAGRIADGFANTRFIHQPLLAGQRALLAVIKRQVLLCDSTYAYLNQPVANADAFLKLGSGTLFDGVMVGLEFYPFECLALDGRSLQHNTTEERIIMALQMCRLAQVRWMFPTPTRRWLKRLGSNLPAYRGVVRKLAAAPYFPMAHATVANPNWVEMRWN